MELSKSVFKYLIEAEGYAGFSEASKAARTKGSKGDFGEYLDSNGYPTTGYGMLVGGKNKYGTPEYLKQRKIFEKKYSEILSKPVDVVNLNQKDAEKIKKAYVAEKVAKFQQVHGVDITSLPEGVQKGIMGTMFQNGSLGPKTVTLLKDFDSNRSQSSLLALGDEIENYHNEAGLLAKYADKKGGKETVTKMLGELRPRRLKEASFIRGDLSDAIKTPSIESNQDKLLTEVRK
jgi:hypothetical protein